MIALGEACCLVTGNFDLSLESTMAFSAVFGAWLVAGPLYSSGIFIHPLIVIITICLGLIIGFINSIFIIKLGINLFLHLATFVLLKGLTYALTDARAINNIPASIHDFEVNKDRHSSNSTYYNSSSLCNCTYLFN